MKMLLILPKLFFVRSTHFLLFTVFVIQVLLYSAQAEVKLAKNVTITAVFVFGDSLVDTGNNNYLDTIAKANYPPYGRDFIDGKPTGRYSNGKVLSDLILEKLGIEELLPPYLDPNLQIKELVKGVNFASSGSGFDPLTSIIETAASLSKQIEWFKKYIKELKEVAGEDRANTILGNSLVVLVAGINDLCNTYLITRRLEYDTSAYTDFLTKYASDFLQELYKLGAKRVGVLGMLPIGCLPIQRTFSGGIQRKCVKDSNQLAKLLNSKLSKQLSFLNNHLKQAKMVYIDVYGVLLDIIQNPEKFGFKVADRGCCGTGTVEVSNLCNERTPFTCANASEYVFWDSFHPTERTYKIIVSYIFQNFGNQLFGME